MKKIILLLFILLFGVQSVHCAAYVNNLRELFLQDKAVILVVNPRTMGAQDLNDNDIIDFDKGEKSGNFVNAISRLKTIQSQGFNTLHILPVTPVGTKKALGTAGSLYALNGFDTINPQLDDKSNKLTPYEELRNFIVQCHKKRISVIIDLPSCGSYDLYLRKPQLFLTNSKGQPITPADWSDVRVFKTKNSDGSLNTALLNEHKKFIDMMLALNVDGIRADAASMKPFEFWQQIIDYTRLRNPNFLFLAEASQKWDKPVCDQCEFTPYNKLLEAGFDGFLGGYPEYKKFNSANDLVAEYNLIKKYQKSKTPKATVCALATHDIISPVTDGGIAYANQLLWLSIIMPSNPYYVDGFQSLDSYMYEYANQRAPKTWTDNPNYFVHRGKLDIFNFSRRPKGTDVEFAKEFIYAQKIRVMLDKLPLLGSFKTLWTNNGNVWAFYREYESVGVITIVNRSPRPQNSVVTYVPRISSKSSIFTARLTTIPKVEHSKVKSDLAPYEVQMLVWLKNPPKEPQE